MKIELKEWRLLWESNAVVQSMVRSRSGPETSVIRQRSLHQRGTWSSALWTQWGAVSSFSYILNLQIFAKCKCKKFKLTQNCSKQFFRLPNRYQRETWSFRQNNAMESNRWCAELQCPSQVGNLMKLATCRHFGILFQLKPAHGLSWWQYMAELGRELNSLASSFTKERGWDEVKMK